MGIRKKMQVGDYVKREDGKLGRITEFEGDLVFFDNDEFITYKSYHNEIVKILPNILDLIGVDDLLYVDISPDDCGGIVVPRIAETENELKIFKGYIKTGQWVLKGIVTKEHLEKSCYWL